MGRSDDVGENAYRSDDERHLQRLARIKRGGGRSGNAGELVLSDGVEKQRTVTDTLRTAMLRCMKRTLFFVEYQFCRLSVLSKNAGC